MNFFRIIKNVLLLLIFFVYKVNIWSQTTVEDALLWEISGKNLPSKSYLFGTIHLIPKEDFFLPKGLEEALNHSKTLFLELDMNEMNDMGKMMSIFERCYMKDDKKLSDLLDPSDYQLVSNKLEQLGLPMMMFERMKPLFLSTLTAFDGGVSNKELENLKSYELVLTEMANEKNIPLKGIESIDFQLSIFDSIPYEVQAKSLVESLKSDSASTDSMKELINFYKAQKVTKLAESTESTDMALVPYLNILLNNRNKAWIPKILESSKSGSCFYAVGAGHLGGEQGLISLLRKENLTVKPIK